MSGADRGTVFFGLSALWRSINTDLSPLQELEESFLSVVQGCQVRAERTVSQRQVRRA